MAGAADVATPHDLCDSCGEPIAAHDPPVAVRITVGTLPGTVDLDADELEADGLDPYLLAVFDTTQGIGGATVTYGASCCAERLTATAEEVERLGRRSWRRRQKEIEARREAELEARREALEEER